MWKVSKGVIMKGKKIIISLVLLFAIVCSTMISGCLFDSVVPVAFVKLKTEGTQVTRYTADMASSYPHILLFESESDIPNPDNYDQPLDYKMACENSCMLYISFKRNMGKDTINDEDVLVCDIDKWYDMSVYIKKSSTIYNANKDIYLNGQKLTPDYKYDGEYHVSLRFDDFGLVRGNPNGRINNFVNLIEYK